MTSLSRQTFKRWMQQPWFVALLAAYPVLALAVANLDQIRMGMVIRPLIVSVVGACFLWGVLALCFREWRRSAFLAALLILLFYSYGHVYHILREVNSPVGRGRYLVPLWGILTALSIFWATRKSLPLARVISLFNLTTVLLILALLGQIGWFQWQQIRFQRQAALAETALANTVQSDKPDIYYIILDSYGRSDTLQTVYGVDNASFLRDLVSMGFYIAPCSQSNYAQTQFAIASALNLDYLENLGVVRDNTSNDALLITLSRHSLVRRILEANGYKVINFASGFIWSEWPDADMYLSPPRQGRLSEFESLLMRSSFGLALLDAGILHTNAENAIIFRERTLYVLETLPDVAALEGQKFVFVHLIAPHPPFVFGPHGEIRDSGFRTRESQYTFKEYHQGYGEQVEFISKRILPVLQQIILSSSRPPIIILQGDHGPGFSSWSDRMKILNAYYFPSGGNGLYPSISPVNSFRLLLNNYFQANYPLLSDRSYFSSYNTPYDFHEIENDCAVGIASP